MNDWFEWNGKKCGEYGIRAVELPPPIFAQERIAWKSVAGRSGTLAMLEGEAVYEDLTLSAKCRIDDMTRVTEIGAWLTGGGEVKFANRSAGYYKGRISSAIELAQIVQGHAQREFTVSWRVQPYLYLSSAPEIVLSAADLVGGYVITNAGTAASLPRLEITGSGDFSITLGGQMVLLTDVSGGIVLDGELQDALSTDGAQLLNDHMSGDFPEIPTGKSTISWAAFDGNDNAGSVTQIKILPRWRCR